MTVADLCTMLRSYLLPVVPMVPLEKRKLEFLNVRVAKRCSSFPHFVRTGKYALSRVCQLKAILSEVCSNATLPGFAVCVFTPV